MIRSYKEKENENGKRTYDLNDYFQDRKSKMDDELVRDRERNMEAKYPTWFDELNGLSEGQLRQFAIELEDKKNTVKAHLERKKRNLNVQISTGLELENNQPSSRSVGSTSLDEVQTFNHNLMSHDPGWFDDKPDLQMRLGLEADHYEGSHTSLDQGGSLDQPDLQMRLGLKHENKQQADHYVGSHTSLDQGGSHDHGWFGDKPDLQDTARVQA